MSKPSCFDLSEVAVSPLMLLTSPLMLLTSAQATSWQKVLPTAVDLMPPSFFRHELRETPKKECLMVAGIRFAGQCLTNLVCSVSMIMAAGPRAALSTSLCWGLTSVKPADPEGKDRTVLYTSSSLRIRYLLVREGVCRVSIIVAGYMPL